jgi:DNA-binding NarL/FixJ family response regulator
LVQAQTFRLVAESDLQGREHVTMSKHILLVDDSDTVRRITRIFIESQLDLDVCGEAVDGVDAIEKARALNPDLVVLDLAMPRKNGVEAASELRAMNPRTPIVLFTMYDDSLGRTLALSAGANVVISKADGGWKLVECVRNLLEAA